MKVQVQAEQLAIGDLGVAFIRVDDLGGGGFGGIQVTGPPLVENLVATFSVALANRGGSEARPRLTPRT